MHLGLYLSHYPAGISAILLSVVFALACQALLKNLLGKDRIRESHEVGGYYLSIAGTFYAVLLGLVVVDAMSNFKDAEKTLENEASALVNIYILAEKFPQQTRAIRDLATEYTEEVLNEELPMMAHFEISAKARNTALKLLGVLKNIEPVTENQKTLYSSILSETSALWEARRDRTKISNHGIPAVEWVVLIVGAIITIVFTFFFVIESSLIHFTMTGMIVLLISMSLYLVLLFGAPFSGDLRVSDRPFSVAKTFFTEHL